MDVLLPDRGRPAWLGYGVVLPSRDVFRLHFPDGSIKEKAVEVEVGKQVYVRSFE